jgi:hypothetical protein
MDLFTMKVLYILNESSFYMKMALFSISTLRKYNDSIPIEVLYICDNGRDNRLIGYLNYSEFNIESLDKISFFKKCKKFNVKLIVVDDIDLHDENGYHPVQRKEFVRIADDKILLLDADTFIFGDVSCMFDSLNNYDMVMDKNEWGHFGGKFPYHGQMISPFNSGVVLFNNGILQEYGRQVYDLSMKVKGNDHPVGNWLDKYQKYEGSKGKLGREEIAFTLFVYDNKINFRYSNPKEIQTSKCFCKTMIHHTHTQNYIKYWRKYFKSGVFKPYLNLKYKLFSQKGKYTRRSTINGLKNEKEKIKDVS